MILAQVAGLTATGADVAAVVVEVEAEVEVEVRN
jgi:hypothetical protein